MHSLAFRRSIVITVDYASDAFVDEAMYGDEYGEPWLALAMCVPIYIYGIKSGGVDGDNSGGGMYVFRPTADEIDPEWGASDVLISTNADDMLRAFESGKLVYIKIPEINGRFLVAGVEYRAIYGYFLLNIPSAYEIDGYEHKSSWWINNTGTYTPNLD